ncbi:MAG: substrate-binding domain-containing protein [Gammaproteobacteria bacterium]|nr:substrate-binding domain-containing protein [Gammaproteobacteria bacterium]
MNLRLVSLLLCLLGTVAGLLQAQPHILRLATTTSTENAGLLEVLVPEFKNDHGYEVQVIAVGTGKALAMGANGDVDVVLVHAPAAERKFVADGHGVDHRAVMYNDFVVVGPPDDPAGIRGGDDIVKALNAVASNEALFVSRGDDSGTHKKELQLWSEAGLNPNEEWYREVGQGMGKTLQIADELRAYALTDRGTWLALRKKLDLTIVVERDERLFNPYGIMAVNPANYPDINYEGARRLIEWITSPKAQRMIWDYRVEGEPLFNPLAVIVE